MHRREQGDRGELLAMEWFTSIGAAICVPFGHSPHYDFIADLRGNLRRVQVKTSTCWAKERYVVSLCTRGGNQSWDGLVKRLDAALFDDLFVVGTDGRRWCIPSRDLDARSGLNLGGPKYSEFEVERGAPLEVERFYDASKIAVS
jgi:hypothetical protein